MPNPVRLELPGISELSWLEIDLAKLEANARAIRKSLDAAAGVDRHGRPVPASEQKRTAICAVMKKDAYGLGAVTVAHRMVKAGVEMLAVYSPAEAAQLVSNAVTAPILVLMPLRELNRTDALYRHAVAEKLHLSIHDRRQLSEVNEIGQSLGIKIPCHLYVDTGMSRSGLSPEQAIETLASTTAHRYIRIAGIFTHFANGGTDIDKTYAQLDAFEEMIERAGATLPGNAVRHVASTSAMLRSGALHLDMVRPGSGLLGYMPDSFLNRDESEPWLAEPPTLQPALRWCSRVIHVQRYPRRTPVSYGSTFKLKRESVLGIVPIGHGDGYPVALSNKAEVRIRPRAVKNAQGKVEKAYDVTACRVLGQVSMDQIVVDLTDVLDDPKQDYDFLLDAWAEIYSPSVDAPNALPKLAAMAKSNVYEMLCRLSANLPRKYVNG